MKKIKSLLSLFGASGYRYKFSLFMFDKVHGVEDAFPDEGAVFVFLRRVYDILHLRFSYKLIHCGATKDLSALSVARLSKRFPSLLSSNCLGVLYEKVPKERSCIVSDIIRRNFT